MGNLQVISSPFYSFCFYWLAQGIFILSFSSISISFQCNIICTCGYKQHWFSVDKNIVEHSQIFHGGLLKLICSFYQWYSPSSYITSLYSFCFYTSTYDKGFLYLSFYFSYVLVIINNTGFQFIKTLLNISK